MKTFLDCIPCFIRQALDAVRLATSDEIIHERVLRGVMDQTARLSLNQSPPVMGQQVHRIARNISRNQDPYRQVKDRLNRYALDIYPLCQKMINRSSVPFETAVRLAIAGNIIDLGPHRQIGPSDINDALDHALSGRLPGDIELLSKAVRSVENILYLYVFLILLL